MLNDRRLPIFSAAWWLLWSCLHAYTLYSFEVSWQLAIADSLISNFLALLACSTIAYSLKYYRPAPEKTWQLLLWVVVVCVPVYLINSWCLALLSNSDKHYSELLHFSAQLRFVLLFIICCAAVIINWIWHLLASQQREREVLIKTEQLAKETELATLRQQLHPHFLFNTLNSVSALIDIDPEEARKMVHQLADFLRGTLHKDDRQLISLKEELEQIALYLSIEKVRFGHRLDTSITCDDICMKLKLPAYIIQPMVENAVKFGLYDTIEKVSINITAYCENNMLIIAISNPFDPTTARAIHGTGFGLAAIQRRLFLLYGRNDLFQTEQNEHLFTAIVKIPQR